MDLVRLLTLSVERDQRRRVIALFDLSTSSGDAREIARRCELVVESDGRLAMTVVSCRRRHSP